MRRTKEKIGNNKIIKGVSNSRTGKFIGGAFKFTNKHVAPSLYGAAIGFAVADNNPVDEMIAGGIIGHKIMEKGILPQYKKLNNNLNLHMNYIKNAKDTQTKVENQFENLEKTTGKNFDATTVEGKQNIQDLLNNIKNKLNTGELTKSYANAIEQYKQYLMNFESKTKMEAEIMTMQKLNDINNNKIDYTNLDGAERKLVEAQQEKNIADQIEEFSVTNMPINGDFRDVETMMLNDATMRTGKPGQQVISKTREEMRAFKQETDEVIKEIKEYMKSSKDIKDEIEMLRRQGKTEQEVIQIYEKKMKKINDFKVKVENKKLNKYIDPKEYAELDKLSQRIENDQLNTINKADYEKLALDVYRPNSGNNSNNGNGGNP